MPVKDEALKQLIFRVMDSLVELDEELVKKWIHKTWPRGIGLYE